MRVAGPGSADADIHHRTRCNPGDGLCSFPPGHQRTISANLSNCFDSLVKGQPLVIGNATTIRVSGKSRNVPLKNKHRQIGYSCLFLVRSGY